MTTEKNAAAEERIRQLLHTLGKAYLERRQFAEAYAKLSQLLQLDPDNAEVLEETALAAIGSRDVSATALALYEKAVAAQPNAEHLLTALATLFSTHQ
ncbi:MAG: tetratricopeptide repeat protein, partial [Calditrichaeota bacterium]